MRLILALVICWPMLGAAQLQRADADALLAAWLKAQNEGDFAAYSALYAQKFSGVKRAGRRVKRYARAGWLKDRGAMFKGKFTVEVEDVTARLSGATARLSFVQTWASKRYKDRGTKLLFLVLEGGQARIAREEMVDSEVLADAAEAPIDPLRWGFVVESGGEPLLIFKRGIKGACASAPKLISRSPAEARCPLQPQAEGDLRGKAVDLYGEDGRLCRATLKAPQRLVKFQPHFGQVQAWSERYTEPQIIEELMEQADTSDGFLAYTIEDEGSCTGAHWFREAKRPPVIFASAQPLSGPEADAALKALRALEGWRLRQADFKRFKAEEGHKGGAKAWDMYNRNDLSATRYQLGGEAFTAVSVSAGAGCGDFGERLWGLWRDQRLISDPKHPGDLFTPKGLIKIDGELFFLEHERLSRPLRGVYEIREGVKINDYDCPC